MNFPDGCWLAVRSDWGKQLERIEHTSFGGKWIHDVCLWLLLGGLFMAIERSSLSPPCVSRAAGLPGMRCGGGVSLGEEG